MDDAQPKFSADQLDQMVAPVALYPDSLLMQVLIASTYPLEVVEADRWRRQQGDIKDDALDKALEGKDWDPSIEGLTHFPDLLKRMSDNLDWTKDMGDAFLGQKDERPRRRPAHAPPGAGGRHAPDLEGADGHQRDREQQGDDRHPAGQPGGGVRADLRAERGVRLVRAAGAVLPGGLRLHAAARWRRRACSPSVSASASGRSSATAATGATATSTSTTTTVAVAEVAARTTTTLTSTSTRTSTGAGPTATSRRGSTTPSTGGTSSYRDQGAAKRYGGQTGTAGDRQRQNDARGFDRADAGGRGGQGGQRPERPGAGGQGTRDQGNRGGGGGAA